MLFCFKTHNFCYGYDCRLHYSGVNGDVQKHCSFSLQNPRLCFSVTRPKLILLITMVCVCPPIISPPFSSRKSGCGHLKQIICVWLQVSSSQICVFYHIIVLYYIFIVQTVLQFTVLCYSSCYFPMEAMDRKSHPEKGGYIMTGFLIVF